MLGLPGFAWCGDTGGTLRTVLESLSIFQQDMLNKFIAVPPEGVDSRAILRVDIGFHRGIILRPTKFSPRHGLNEGIPLNEPGMSP